MAGNECYTVVTRFIDTCNPGATSLSPGPRSTCPTVSRRAVALSCSVAPPPSRQGGAHPISALPPSTPLRPSRHAPARLPRSSRLALTHPHPPEEPAREGTAALSSPAQAPPEPPRRRLRRTFRHRTARSRTRPVPVAARRQQGDVRPLHRRRRCPARPAGRRRRPGEEGLRLRPDRRGHRRSSVRTSCRRRRWFPPPYSSPTRASSSPRKSAPRSSRSAVSRCGRSPAPDTPSTGTTSTASRPRWKAGSNRSSHLRPLPVTVGPTER